MTTMDRIDEEKWMSELAVLPIPDLSEEKAQTLRSEALRVLRKRARVPGRTLPAWTPAALRLAARIAGSALGTGWLYCAFRQAARFLGV